ncbi:CDP-glucose 4,6-dehydratase [Lysinibacillus pakistanensis]|uniref:CDP-glucose 4,6-dehydratase n=1 Tax=Lysinibacillus pakistanensis TaxID=759811 RepID=UPI003D29DDEB
MINTSFWKGKKIFLTGHTGFKGSWLSIWLNELGAIVHGYALEPNTDPSLFKLAGVENLIESTIADIQDLQRLKKTMIEFQPDIVIHMAAQPLVRESYTNPIDTYSINVMGTAHVLESVRYSSTVKAVINVTTDKVYENKEWVWGYREEDRLGGYDPYSNSKACSELVTSSYINSFFNPNDYEKHGVAIATARSGNVIGGGDWATDRLIPDVMRAVVKQEEIIIRNPNAIRPWQHVLEPLLGYLILAEKLYLNGIKWSGAWNFGPDFCDMKVQELLDVFLANFETKCNIKYELTNIHEAQLLKLSCDKAKNILGWKPLFSTEEAISQTSQWYKNTLTTNQYLEYTLQQIRGIL